MILQWLLSVFLVYDLGFGSIDDEILKMPQLTPHYFSKQIKTTKESLSLNLAIQPLRDVYVYEPPSLSLSELSNKYHSTFLMYGPGTKREVSLTFDDAPDTTFTPQILDILKQKEVKATFFVVGTRVKDHPDIVKRIIQEGHALGNHSYNHANFSKLTDVEFHNQIIKTDSLLSLHTGFIPNIIRPPYGNISEGQIQWLATQNKKIVNWNVDSLDWKGLSAEQVSINVLSKVRPGAIVLQHSGTGKGGDLSGTVNALPKIIDELKKEGYRLVTIPELLDIPAVD